MCSLTAGQLAYSPWVCWPLTNNWSNRVGEIHTYRRFAVSCYVASFPVSILAHFHWDTRVLWDNQADRCSPTASLRGVWWHQRGCSDLKVEMGFRGPGMAGDHAVERGGRISIGWSRRTAITAHQYRAVMSHWVLTGFPLGQDQYPSSTPPFSLNRSEDKFFLHVLFSLLSQWVSVVILDML